MIKKKNKWEEREGGVLIFIGEEYVYALSEVPGPIHKEWHLLLDSVCGLRISIRVKSKEVGKQIVELLEL